MQEMILKEVTFQIGPFQAYYTFSSKINFIEFSLGFFNFLLLIFLDFIRLSIKFTLLIQICDV